MTRIAVIIDAAFDTNESPLVSLLEAEISQQLGIELLERTLIRRILAEQKLSLSGLLEKNNTLKVGHLLRVDAFLILELVKDNNGDEKQGKLLRVRVVETVHGIRLLDSFEQINGEKLEDLVRRIKDKVIDIIPKLKLPTNRAIPIGIVNIHCVQLGEKYKFLERVLPKMLSARLSKEPRIIMLEREDLKVLANEKLLAEGENSKFWSSAVLIEGYLQPKRIKDVEIRLSLRQAFGEEITNFTVLVEPNEPSAAVNNIANSIIQQLLNAPPAVSWEPEKEADEFFHQGQLLMNHQQNNDAMALLETAHALQPENVFYTGAIFENEWNARYTKERTPPFILKETGLKIRSDSELVDVVSLLVRQLQKVLQTDSLRESLQKPQIPRQVVLAWKLKDYFMSSTSVSTDEIRQFNRINRKIWADALQQTLEDVEKTDRCLLENVWYRSLPGGLAWAGSDSPEEAIDRVKKIAIKYITPPEMGGQCDSVYSRLMSTRSVLLFPEIFLEGFYVTIEEAVQKTQLMNEGAKLEGLWIQFLEDLTKIEDPLERYGAYIALARYYPPMKRKESCQSALDVLLNDLNSPNEPGDDTEKWFLRENMDMALCDEAEDVEAHLASLNKIYDPLIEKKDVHNISLWCSALRNSLKNGYYSNYDIETAKRFAILYKRIIAVLEDSNDTSAFTGLARVKDAYVSLCNYFPDLNTSERLQIYQTSMLLDKSNLPNEYQYVSVILEKNMLWVAFADPFADPDIGLAEINLESKQLKSLWQANCGKGTTLHENLKGEKISGPLTGIAVFPEACYVAVRDIGLVKFSRTSDLSKKFIKHVEVLTEANGLPSVSITAIAKVRDKLWVAYGGIDKESGLIIYDPAKGSFDTVFCSTLDGAPPFNSGRSYAISFLTPYLENTLFFILGERDNDRKLEIKEKWWGLWKIDINNKETKLIWRDENNPMVLEAIEDAGTAWWLRDLYSLVEFDPNSEKAKFVFGITREWKDWAIPVFKPTIPMPELQKDFFVPESRLPEFAIGHDQISLRTATVYGDKLWACLGFNQIIVIHKGKGHADAELFENNILDGRKVLRFVSTPYGLIAIGYGTIGLVENSGNP